MWSDNLGELTTDDVKYSFERMLKTDWSARWPTLDHVEVKDKYSGVIVLKSPFDGTFLMGVASESGSILPKAAMLKLKDQKFTTQLPAQLGPYTMVSWTPKQRAVLKANPDWKGAKVAFPDIILVDIEDEKAAELGFEAHEVQVTHIPLETAARYKKSPPAGGKLITLPGPLYTWMGMNTQNPKLSDIRIRQAIQRAIDTDSVIEGAYAGESPKAHGVIPLGILGHRDASKFSYKPDEAKDLLKQAGVSNLDLTLVALNSEPEQVAAAQIIQANLADVGLNVKVVPTDSGPYWNLGLESKGTPVEDPGALDHALPLLAGSGRRHPVVQEGPGRRLELGALVDSGIRDALDPGSGGDGQDQAQRDLSAHAGDHGGHRRLCLADLRSLVLRQRQRGGSRLRVRRRNAGRAVHEGLIQRRVLSLPPSDPLPTPGHFVPGVEAGEGKRSAC